MGLFRNRALFSVQLRHWRSVKVPQIPPFVNLSEAGLGVMTVGGRQCGRTADLYSAVLKAQRYIQPGATPQVWGNERSLP